MKISTLIEVSGDSYPYTEEAAAAQVLAALGGNPANDTSAARVTFHKLKITCNVSLEQDDNMPYTAEGAADQVMAALAGNPTTDYAVVILSMSPAAGEAGVVP